MSDPRSDAPTPEAVRARLLWELSAMESAATFVEQYARACCRHTEAVADCPHCNLLFLARWARDAAGLLRPTPASDVERLREALGRFAAGAGDGIWGKWKAWIVAGAPTHAEGIQAARQITEWQSQASDALYATLSLSAGSPLAGERILQKAHEEKNPETRVDSVPGSEHGDLPRPPTGDK